MASSDEILNPFSHNLEPMSSLDKIRIAIFTVIVFPVRISLGLIFLTLCWISVSIGMCGLTNEDLVRKPMKKWRIYVKKILAHTFFRLTFMTMGFHYIKIKGKRATRTEAPILVAAPHSTFLDTLLVGVLEASVISSVANGNLPIVGKIIRFIQPIFVDKEDRNSRHNAVLSVFKRVTSSDDWPQVLIFPEGTCTNGRSLISFGLGAFNSGVPVQPVLCRYPNKVNTVTWTWYGPRAWKTCWYTMTRIHTNCEIELLPVYRPSDEEKKNPELYARNVQRIMAKALDVPISDYSCREPWIAKQASDLGLSSSSQLVKMQKLRNQLRLPWTKIEEEWMEKNSDVFKNNSQPMFISMSDFATLLGVNEDQQSLKQLFEMYAEDGSFPPILNWQRYLFSIHLMNKATSKENMIRLAFEHFDGHVNKCDFQYIMQLICSVSNDDSEHVFEEIARDGETTITYESFLASKMCQTFLQESNSIIRSKLKNEKTE